MTRETSIEVYHQIKEEGLLSKRRFQVYDALFKYGPMTQSECSSMIGGLQRSLTPRFAELSKTGTIRELGKRECKVTGRVVYVYDVTAELPVKISNDKPKKPSKESIRAFVASATLNLEPSHNTNSVLNWLRSLAEVN